MAFKVHSRETSLVNECDKPNPNLRHIKQMLNSNTFSKEMLIGAMSAAISNDSYKLMELLSEWVDVPKFKLDKHKISNFVTLICKFNNGVEYTIIGREDERIKSFEKLQSVSRKYRVRMLDND